MAYPDRTDKSEALDLFNDLREELEGLSPEERFRTVSVELTFEDVLLLAIEGTAVTAVDWDISESEGNKHVQVGLKLMQAYREVKFGALA